MLMWVILRTSLLALPRRSLHRSSYTPPQTPPIAACARGRCLLAASPYISARLAADWLHANASLGPGSLFIRSFVRASARLYREDEMDHNCASVREELKNEAACRLAVDPHVTQQTA